MELLTLYPYSPERRRQINRIKAARCIATMRLFLTECLSDLRLCSALFETSLIIPASSSLYSRLSGKFDLAHSLAYESSRAFGCQLQLGKPNWRLQKRSRVQQRQRLRHFTVMPRYAFQNRCDRIVLIDDVITSGQTLWHLFQSTGYPQERVIFIALCDPRSPNFRPNSRGMRS